MSTSAKTRSIIYWTSTILIGFVLLSAGVAESIHYSGNVDGIVKKLGYPMYFLNIQGGWKILGGIALLIPRFPLVIAGITVVSWIYRPSSRRLGNYFRNSSITPSATGG